MKTFRDFYEEAKKMPAPPTYAQAFITSVAKLTHRKEQTVKMWLYSDQEPDQLAKSILAKHFKTTPEKLFPKS